jgi:hypothetical protein
MRSFSVKRFDEGGLAAANGDDTVTGGSGTDGEAPTLADASPAEINAYYSKVFATQGDMKKLISEAADRIKNQRAPSVWGALSEGLAQPKTQPGISGTLANISSGLSEYRKGKTAFDEAQADKLMAYRLKELELGGSQAKSELDLKIKLANLNKGANQLKYFQGVTGDAIPWRIAINPKDGSGEVTYPTLNKTFPIAAANVKAAVTALNTGAQSSTVEKFAGAGGAPVVAPAGGAPAVAKGLPIRPGIVRLSSAEYMKQFPDEQVPPNKFWSVNTLTGKAEPVEDTSVNDLKRPQALAQGYFRGQRKSTGELIFAEADRAPPPEELSRMNSSIAANIGKKTLVMGTLDKALGDVTNLTAGFGGKLLKDLPGPALDQANRIRTIKANVGFDQLQAMRDASKTGGALGQVAVQELDMLQASLGSLEQAQGVDELAYNLAQVKDHYQKAIEALKVNQYENEALRREILAAQGRPYTPKPKTPAKPAAAVDLNSFYNKPR